ncbi:hypothetical protein V1477_016220 [Vespula maculifrons]|uniref:Uncharacterized protein n=1 Tax=Vespula maculifrons TaxID=7453 RepID=A0ABD2BCJ1_VESMC
MSKSIIWRRSRREGEEKKAGTCAHLHLTKTGVRKSSSIIDTERGKPAQKPTPTSPTHRHNFSVLQVLPTQVPPLGAIDYETNISTIYGITLADMSKSIIWRRSRREGEEKKAGTCAHLHLTKTGVRKSSSIIDTERGKPAQKPTPTSPTHRSHPKEIRIMNIEYLFPSIGKMDETM